MMVDTQYTQSVGDYDQLAAALDDGLAYYRRAVADGAVTAEETLAYLETLTAIAHRYAGRAVEALGSLAEATRAAERQAALIEQQQALILAIRAEIGALLARVAQ